MGESWRFRAAGGLLGGLLGSLGAWVLAPALVAPQPVDPTHWRVISPRIQEGIYTPGVGRGIHVGGGALVMTAHAFASTDVLTATAALVERVELTVAEDSGPLQVRVGAPPHLQVMVSAERAWLMDGGAAAAASSPTRSYAVFFDAAGGWLAAEGGGAPVLLAASAQPGGLELSTLGAQSRVTRIRLLGAGQALLAEEDFTRSALGGGQRLGVALAGGLVGAGALGVLARGAGRLVLGALWLVPPLLLGVPSAEVWLQLTERLYLEQTPPWWLLWGALGLWGALLGARLLLETPLLDGGAPRAAEDGRAARVAAGVWGAGVLAALLLGTHPPRSVGEAILAVSGALLLVLPGAVAWRGGLALQPWLLRDLPALLVVAVLGWGKGLLAVVVWRLLVVAGSVRGLLRHAPAQAAPYLLGLLLLLPAGLEALIRSTALEQAWNGAHLSRESASERSWQVVSAFWRGRCPEAPPTAPMVAFLGGSSTGGAYQLRDSRAAFFAGQALDGLCADGGPGVEVINYGASDANTFTISRTIQQVLLPSAPDLLVLYVGVNDLLTRQHTQTRAQREAILADRQRPVQGLAALGRQLRLITALSLLVRPQEDGGTLVSAVPLADAEENHHRIARATEGTGTQVILLTELITASMVSELEPYAAMQRRVADAWPHVTWVDVPALLGHVPPDTLLADRNHLSRAGNQRLGAALAPVLRQTLDHAPGPPAEGPVP